MKDLQYRDDDFDDDSGSSTEAEIFHEIECTKCENKTFKIVIMRMSGDDLKMYGLAWMCTKCDTDGKPQLIIPMEDAKPLKGLIELNIKTKNGK